MDKTMKTRLVYLGSIVAVIVLGLVSRRVPAVPAAVGDALWAAVVYCCWRIVLTRRQPWVSAAAALVTSYAVEFSQLIRWDWLVRVRATTIGHLLLGQGFVWSDLIAYTAGIAAAMFITLAVRRK